MKKIFILFIITLLICGCEKKTSNIVQNEEKVYPEKVEVYKDYNNTPIGIYSLKGNTLTRINNFDFTPIVEQDIGVFQIFPSNDDVVYLDTSFGQSFYNEWVKYNTNNSLKIGFNISFTKNNEEEISYNIFGPGDTFNHWEQLMNYLYDDYANLGKGFYSHIEDKDFNDNTLFTAFKMQSSYQVDQIASGIKFQVFTYDSEDDFVDSLYRGNSSHTVNLCINGVACK